MNTKFTPGKNIAMKVPPHEYEKTVAFYRDILGFRQIQGEFSSSTESVRFDFDGKVLWIDKVPSLSQAEIWLEVCTDDIEGASEYLRENGCSRCDEIEELPDDFKGFWISNPANIIHLVAQSDET